MTTTTKIAKVVPTELSDGSIAYDVWVEDEYSHVVIAAIGLYGAQTIADTINDYAAYIDETETYDNKPHAISVQRNATPRDHYRNS